MTDATDDTDHVPHGLFYMENAGGYRAAPARAASAAADAHQPSCFALEEEKGEGWKGVGASGPAIKDKRPRL